MAGDQKGMENKVMCEDCNGYGRLEEWWGCGDPECCGTDMCYPCDGTGEIELDGEENGK